jgi:hypothetical protein
VDKLIEFLQRILEWVVELLLWVPRKVYEMFLDGAASMFEAIPVPGFMSQLGNYAAGLDPALGYFLAPLQLEVGLGFVMLAYIIRFAIRRLPVIG